jgi:hypothetical protein
MQNNLIHARSGFCGRLILLTLCAAALAGCVSSAFVVGDSYGEPPPQVVYMGAEDAQGKPYLTWHRSWAFGPVPSELQSSGDMSCMKLGYSLRAVAYHPRALDLNGQATPGGGFFCQPQPLQNLADARPPQVVVKDGMEGWDRPGAFGPIPEDRLSAANQVCTQQNPKAKPLGFHFRPLNASGQPMLQGGYLCAE